MHAIQTKNASQLGFFITFEDPLNQKHPLFQSEKAIQWQVFDEAFSSPELNPAEKMWAILKRKFTEKLHKILDQVSYFISQVVKKFTEKRINKICSLEYIFSNLNWTI